MRTLATSLVQHSRSLGSTLGSAARCDPALNFTPTCRAGCRPAPDRCSPEALHWSASARLSWPRASARLFLNDVPFGPRHAEPLAKDPRPATTVDAMTRRIGRFASRFRAAVRAAEPWTESVAASEHDRLFGHARLGRLRFPGGGGS